MGAKERERETLSGINHRDGKNHLSQTCKLTVYRRNSIS